VNNSAEGFFYMIEVPEGIDAYMVIGQFSLFSETAFFLDIYSSQYFEVALVPGDLIDFQSRILRVLDLSNYCRYLEPEQLAVVSIDPQVAERMPWLRTVRLIEITLSDL